MKSIITTYPDFHVLPKGIKRMLLASESFFFAEACSPSNQPRLTPEPRFKPANSAFPVRGANPSSLFGSAWKN